MYMYISSKNTSSSITIRANLVKAPLERSPPIQTFYTPYKPRYKPIQTTSHRYKPNIALRFFSNSTYRLNLCHKAK